LGLTSGVVLRERMPKAHVNGQRLPHALSDARPDLRSNQGLADFGANHTTASDPTMHSPSDEGLLSMYRDSYSHWLANVV